MDSDDFTEHAPAAADSTEQSGTWRFHSSSVSSSRRISQDWSATLECRCSRCRLWDWSHLLAKCGPGVWVWQRGPGYWQQCAGLQVLSRVLPGDMRLLDCIPCHNVCPRSGEGPRGDQYSWPRELHTGNVVIHTWWFGAKKQEVLHKCNDLHTTYVCKLCATHM